MEQTRLRGILDIAIPRMEREHRRYFRYDVDLPVRFRNPLGQSFTARIQKARSSSSGAFPGQMTPGSVVLEVPVKITQ